MISFKQYLAESTFSNFAEIKTNFPDADFWLIRKGSEHEVGRPTKEFSPEHIGVKVDRSVLLPDYAFYAMQHVHSQGYYKPLARGTLRLKNILTDHVKNIRVA